MAPHCHPDRFRIASPEFGDPRGPKEEAKRTNEEKPGRNYNPSQALETSLTRFPGIPSPFSMILWELTVDLL